MINLGDYEAGTTSIIIPFTTHSKAGGIIAPSTAFEVADLKVYKNNSATERSSASGITMTSPFDTITGVHLVLIDLSDDTDSGFWAAGNDYFVLLDPDETVDSEDPTKVLAIFSIGNRFNKVDVTKWLGTAVPTPSILGIPEVTLANVGAHGGTVAVLTLKKVTVDSTDTDASAVAITGNGSGAGLEVVGGATSGAAIDLLGGNPNGPALALGPAGTGKCISFLTPTQAFTAAIIAAGTFASNAIDAAAIAADAIGSSELSAAAANKIRDAIWNALLTGGTYNIATSAGKRLRAIDAAFEVHSGTAQAGSTSTTFKMDTGASTVDNIYRGDRIIIVGGTGVGEHGIAISYVGSTRVASMSKTWIITPDDTSEFEVVPADVDVETWANAIVTSAHLDENIAKIAGSTLAATLLKDNLLVSKAIALKAGTLTTTQFSTTATEVNDVFKDRVFMFDSDTTTAALRLQAKTITGFLNTNGVFTCDAFTTPPVATDTGRVI